MVLILLFLVWDCVLRDTTALFPCLGLVLCLLREVSIYTVWQRLEGRRRDYKFCAITCMNAETSFKRQSLAFITHNIRVQLLHILGSTECAAHSIIGAPFEPPSNRCQTES